MALAKDKTDRGVDEQMMAGKLREEQKEARKENGLSNRLQEAKQRVKGRNLKGDKKAGKYGKKIAGKAKKKVAQGSDNIFYVLILIAAFIDLIVYLDIGTFTTLINIGIYLIVVVGGFILWFFKSSKNKFSLFNLLKGQLWKYLVLPLFEWIPLISLLPFWTGTVVLMWLKFKNEKRKMIKKEERELKKLQAQYAENF